LASSPPRCSRRVARMPASWMPGTGRCAPIGISAALLGKIWPRRGACSDLAIVERAAIARKDIVDRCAIFEVAFGHSPFPWPGLSGPCRDVTLFYSRIEPGPWGIGCPVAFCHCRPSDERAAQPIDADSDVSRPPPPIDPNHRSQSNVGLAFLSLSCDFCLSEIGSRKR